MVRVEGLGDRVAVVTGGGRGIGLAICRVLAANGARVATLDLTPPEEPGILGVEADVSDEAAVNAAFDEIEAALGQPTILVLNAGILMLFEPVVGVILAAIVLGESMTVAQAIGTALVLLGALVLQRNSPPEFEPVVETAAGPVV